MRRHGWCTAIPDEHYIPTLLAALGKDNETDCLGGLTSVDWGRNEGAGHPYAYRLKDITKQLWVPVFQSKAALAIQTLHANFCPPLPVHLQAPL